MYIAFHDGKILAVKDNEFTELESNTFIHFSGVEIINLPDLNMQDLLQSYVRPKLLHAKILRNRDALETEKLNIEGNSVIEPLSVSIAQIRYTIDKYWMYSDMNKDINLIQKTLDEYTKWERVQEEILARCTNEELLVVGSSIHQEANMWLAQIYKDIEEYVTNIKLKETLH